MRAKIQKNFSIVFVGFLVLLCLTLVGCGKQLEMTDINDVWSYNLTDNTATIKKKFNDYQFKINLESSDSFETQDSSNGKVVMLKTAKDSFVLTDCSSNKDDTQATIDGYKSDGKHEIIKETNDVDILLSDTSVAAYLPKKEVLVLCLIDEKPSNEQIEKMFEF